MNKLLPFAFCLLALASCKNTVPPKEIAREFIQAVYTADAAKASELATPETKAAVTSAQIAKPSLSAEEAFALATLTESISGNTVDVQNDVLKLHLLKESEGWKVAASPELVGSIASRENELAQLKAKWDALVREYESRQEVARNYVQFKKVQGAPSLPVQNMEALLKTLGASPATTKSAILDYVKKQKAMDELVDKALEPSYAANVDLSMTYFLQLSTARDQIKKAVADYNEAVKKTPSPNFPLLP